MKAKEVKKILITKNLTITGMARALEPESEATFDSLRVMLTDLLYGRRFFPKLAAQVQAKWGIEITRHQNIRTTKQDLKKAA